MFARRHSRTKPVPPALTLAQSWWLFAAASAALLPLVAYLPFWLSASAAAGMLWRAWLIRRSGRLPPRWLLMLLVIAGCIAVVSHYHGFFGRNPGQAMLVLFLALKLLELRSLRDGLTVILLACFLLLSSFLFNQGIAATVLVAVALIINIAALISLQAGPHPSVAQQLRHSALLLAQALPFMLVFFLLFPRIQGPLWGMPQDGLAATSGLSETMAPGSISRVAQSDAIAFRARFAGQAPPPQQQYWRAVTMSYYDGMNWRYQPSPEHDTLPYAPKGTAIRYEVTLEPSNQRWLPVLEQAGRLPPDSRFDSTGLVLANQPVRNRLRYDMVAYPDFQPGADENPRRLTEALRLPPGVNPRTRAQADAWRAQYTRDSEIVQAALSFFQHQNLSYTLNPPLMLDNPVDTFLFEQKRGFCEHFASAFAFAMRAAGIPARIIGGYQGGEINPVDGYFTVHQYDAHVWVEVWLSARGWVRVDPTAESAPLRIEGGLRTAVSADEAPLLIRENYAWLRELRYRLDAATNTWNQAVLGFNMQRQRDVLSRLGMPDPDWRQMSAWLAGLSGALMLGLTLYVMRERTRDDPIQRLWLDFRRRLLRAGYRPMPWQGPQALMREASAQLPAHAPAIQAIVTTYIGLRYAKPLAQQDATMPSTDPLARLRDQINRFRP